MLSRFVATIFYFYNIIIFIRIFLSWIPSINWESQPFNFIRSITDPFLNVFRGIIPPIGMFDISPVVAILVLQILQTMICKTLVGMGL